MIKNKAMRLGYVMLVLALLTTCAISGTFAKYTASSETKDVARVAYWGFTSSDTTTLALFNHGDAKVVSGGTVNEVSNVIAPGTTNSADLIFSYNVLNDTIKAPEVSYTFKVEAENTGSTTFLDNADGFNWTLKVGEDGTENKYAKTSDLLTALNNLSASDTVSAGSLPSTVFDGTTAKKITIGWRWDFTDESSTASDDTKEMRDTADTAFASVDEANLQNVKLNIKVTATQAS